MFVQFCVPAMVTTAAGCVTVKKVTKVSNVKFRLANVKCLAVLRMDVALTVNVIVSEASKELIVLNVSFLFLSSVALTIKLFTFSFLNSI